MSKYEQIDKHFYSEGLDVLIKSLGTKSDLGHVMHVIYSGNEAYKSQLIEATEKFLDDNFVECDFDATTNEISFLGEDDDGSDTP
jgi:hypothetical protein